MRSAVTDAGRDQVAHLCRRAFGPTTEVTTLEDVNRGRGAFSVVLRAELRWPGAGPRGREPAAGERPSSVVAKLPIDGPNGRAAATSGAYRREALAYTDILPDGPTRTARLHAIDRPEPDSCALLLEDLTPYRAVDQLEGLSPADATEVATDLARFHRSWAGDERLAALEVRRTTIAGLPAAGLSAGLAALESSWAGELSDDDRRRYRALVAARPELVEQFERAAPTLCHGDPRADNLVFVGDEPGSGIILFDWQQMAIQFGEADLAWLAATSLEPEVRRRIDDDLVDAYGGDRGRYRLGMALPGLTVLLLAQRRLTNERTRRFVAASLTRIAAALDDLEVVGLA